MATKVKVDGFENTQENNKLLRKIIKILYPLTSNIQEITEIEVGKEFFIKPFSRKTEEEIVEDIKSLMRVYSEKPF